VQAMQEKPKGLFFLCCYCRTELDETQIFAFRGTVGCQSCVKDYYRHSSAEELESQLRTRRQSALVWLERNRKSLEKHAKRAAAT